MKYAGCEWHRRDRERQFFNKHKVLYAAIKCGVSSRKIWQTEILRLLLKGLIVSRNFFHRLEKILLQVAMGEVFGSDLEEDEGGQESSSDVEERDGSLNLNPKPESSANGKGWGGMRTGVRKERETTRWTVTRNPTMKLQPILLPPPEGRRRHIAPTTCERASIELRPCQQSAGYPFPLIITFHQVEFHQRSMMFNNTDRSTQL